MMFAASFN